MSNQFQTNWLAAMPYKSKQDVYENLYLKAIIDSYQHVDKTIGLENEIRDRIVYDLSKRNPITKKWIDWDFLEINFEKWLMVSEEEKRRVDISFFWSGFGSFEVECKLLFQQPAKNKPYLDDGLVRFIELKYAEKNQYAAMIGFVVSGNISNIFTTTINKTLAFYPSSLNTFIMKPVSLNWNYSFVSFHERVNKNDIQIYHLMFKFDN